MFLTGKRIAFAAMLSLMIGCGGSGGGSNDAVLTSQNMELAAQQGLGATDFLMDMTDLVDVFTAVLDNPVAQVIPCEDGNLDLALVDAAPQNQLSAGDSATFTFNACVINVLDETLTINGTISYTVVAVAGSEEQGSFVFEIAADFDNVAIVGFGATVVVDGGFTLAISSTDGETLTHTVTGDSLRAFAQGPEGNSFSGRLEDFTLVREFNTESGDFLLDFTGTVSGSEVNGTVHYETLVPFTGNVETDPDSGMLVITGAAGVEVTLVAIDDENVRILIDVNGDGEPEATIDTTWDVLNDEV